MNRKLLAGLVLAASLGGASAAQGTLVQSQTYAGAPVSYTNGGGSGFGGTLGGSTISFDIVGSNLVVSINRDNFGGNAVAVMLDVAPGGFTDADLTDVADQGRRTVTTPAGNALIAFPGNGAIADNSILPEYGIAFADWGTASFKLKTGFLDFQTFTAGAGSSRVNSIPLATLGAGPGSVINFFAYLTSGDSYMSNETLPAGSLSALGGNVAYGDGGAGGVAVPPGGFGINNYNQFVIPEPSALGLLAPAAIALTRRRRA